MSLPGATFGFRNWKEKERHFDEIYLKTKKEENKKIIKKKKKRKIKIKFDAPKEDAKKLRNAG